MKFVLVDQSKNAWGMELHFVTLAAALAAKGHSVTAIVQRDSRVQDLLLSKGIMIVPLPIRGGADPRLIAELLRCIRHDRPDWLIANQSRMYWPLAALGWLFGVRIALFRHLVRIKRWQTRKLLPRAVDRFFVSSNYARDTLIENGAPAHRITRLYNPIDTERFRPDSAKRATVRTSLGLTDEHVLLGFAGRIDYAKGIGTLRSAACKAMLQFPHIRVLCIGEGAQVQTTRDFVAACGMQQNFILPGWQPGIENHLAAVDVMVVPSVETETFGRVSAEAQACGIPVIASTVGGLPETLLPGRTGFLFTPGDEAGLLELILRLVADGDLRERVGAAGRSFVSENFSCEIICQEFVANLSQGARSLQESPRLRPSVDPAAPIAAHQEHSAPVTPAPDWTA